MTDAERRSAAIARLRSRLQRLDEHARFDKPKAENPIAFTPTAEMPPAKPKSIPMPMEPQPAKPMERPTPVAFTPTRDRPRLAEPRTPYERVAASFSPLPSFGSSPARAEPPARIASATMTQSGDNGVAKALAALKPKPAELPKSEATPAEKKAEPPRKPRSFMQKITAPPTSGGGGSSGPRRLQPPMIG